MAVFDPRQAVSDALPAVGVYVARIKSIELRQGKNPPYEGYQYVELVTLAKLDGAGNAAPVGKSHTVTDMLSHSPKATARLGLCCFAVGQIEPFDLDSAVACREIFVGKTVLVNIVHEDFRGQNQAKVASAWKAIKGDILTAFPHLAPAATPAPTTGSGPGSSAPGEFVDDIPFSILGPLVGPALAAMLLGAAAAAAQFVS